MLNYIYEMCKKHNCVISVHVGPDGAMTINVYGKRTDFVIIRANWDEETIKGCISDTIRRACE